MLIKKYLILFLIIVAGAGLTYYFWPAKGGAPIVTESRKLVTNWGLKLELADTDTTRTKGLSGRASLPSDTGLLFVFDRAGTYGFWMKEMNFPIDIVWINEAKQVVGITKNLTPESYPQVFYPPEPIKSALEINAGAAEKLGIKKGDQLSWPLDS
ncbi:MAG: DUF192 domain-containing protein [Patescibacteria group bacterium]